MIIEDFDELHNLHLALSIMDAKILVTLLETISGDVFEKTRESLYKENFKHDLVHILAVYQQALMSLKPFTNQLHYIDGLQAAAPISETVQ